MSNSESKNHRRKIINFLQKRDYDEINIGIELLIAIDDSKIYSSLLEEVFYDRNKSKIIPNNIFKGTAPAQPFLDYALISVITNAPKDCVIAEEIKNSIVELKMEVKALPNLSKLEKLEKLDLSENHFIRNIDFLENCNSLKKLNLDFCKNIENINGIEKIKGLKYISFEECSSLKSIKPLMNKNLDNIEINLNQMRTLVNLDGIQAMKKLEKISLHREEYRTNIPNILQNFDSISELNNLSFFGKRKENNLEIFGDYLTSIKGLKALKNANLSWINVFRILAESLVNLEGIQYLQWIKKLEIYSKAQDLSLIGSLAKLEVLSLNQGAFDSLNGLEKLSKLTGLYIYQDSIFSLSGINSLQSLEFIRLSCHELNSLVELRSLSKLETLQLINSPVENLQDIKELSHLKHLTISNAPNLKNFDGIQNMKSLQLSYGDCPKLESLNEISDPFLVSEGEENEFVIDLTEYPLIHDLSILKALDEVKLLTLQRDFENKNGDKIKHIPIQTVKVQNPTSTMLQAISILSVQHLCITYNEECTNLSLEGIKEWKSVKTLTINSKLHGINDSQGDKSVFRKGIRSLNGVEAFTNLEFLFLGSNDHEKRDKYGYKILGKFLNSSCHSLEDLAGIEKLTNLKKIELYDCRKLHEINSIAELPNLNYLNMEGCEKANPFPRPKTMTNRDSVIKFQKRILKSLGKDISHLEQKKKDNNPLKKELSKIKKFLIQPDESTIDEGIELLQSSNNNHLFEMILDGCSISNDGDIIPNKLFKGTKKTQPFIDYAILSLIHLMPSDINIPESLKKRNISKIRLEYSEASLVSGKIFDRISSYQNLSMITLSNLTEIKNLDGLKNCVNLKEISIRYCTRLQNLDGLINCINLKELAISSCNELQNLDGLRNCVNLKELAISSCNELQNLDGLINSITINKLVIFYCGEVQNLDGLKNCVNLKEIILEKCEHLQNLDGLINCVNLDKITIESCDQLQNLDGLINCVNLESLILTKCEHLQNLDGLIKCKNYSISDFDSEYYSNSMKFKNFKELKNINGIANCVNIENLEFINCTSLENIDAIRNQKSLKSLTFKNCDKLIDISALINMNFKSFKFLSENSISLPRGIELMKINSMNLTMPKANSIPPILSKCSIDSLEFIAWDKLKTLNGLESMLNLSSLTLIDCPELNDLSAVYNLKNLSDLYLRTCKIKKSKLPIQLQEITETNF